MACCPPQSLGYASLTEPLRGTETDVGPLAAYVRVPTAPTSRGVLLVHDIFGFQSGRHRQLVDLIAEQGYVVCLPDFFGEEFPQGWTKACRIPRYFWRAVKVHATRAALESKAEHVAAWFAQHGVTHVQWLGFCWGAYGGTVLSSTAALRPLLGGGAACHPALVKLATMCPDAPELRVLLQGMDMPLLWLPSYNDPADEKRGGLVEAFHRENGREIEIVEFNRTHGWVNRS